MENLKQKAFDLRKEQLILLLPEKVAYRRRYECDGHFD